MLRGNNIRGNGLRGKFNPDKHPRGYRGRFIETPDQPKPARKRLGKARVAQTETGSRKISLANTTREQKLALLKKFLDAERLKEKQARQEKLQQLLKARVAQSEDSNRKLVGNKPAIALAEPVKKKGKTLAEAKLALKAAKEAEKKAKAEAKETEKEAAQVKARREAEELAEQQQRVAKKREASEKQRERRLGSQAIPDEYKELYEQTKARTKAQLQDNLAKGVKDPYDISVGRAPTSRPEPEKDSVTFTDAGLELWRDKPQFGRFQAGFKVRENKDFEYAVEHDGQRLVLNRNRKVYEYGGETVEGIPDTHRNLRTLKDRQLFDQLANSIRFTENSSKNIVPPAPPWLHAYGTIDKRYVRSRKGVGEYGESQVHHVDQWAQQRFDEITSKLKYNPKTKQYEDGEITLAEAKTRMGELLVKVEKTDDNGKVTSKYVIKTKPQTERRLVVLAAGVHDINSPLYEANHPKGIHPDTGKLTAFGIPEDGEDGRTGFNAWRAGFWEQHHRREAYIFRQEINRRIEQGDLTSAQAQEYWDIAHQKIVDKQKHLVSLRARRQIERRAVKDAKDEVKRATGGS